MCGIAAAGDVFGRRSRATGTPVATGEAALVTCGGLNQVADLGRKVCARHDAEGIRGGQALNIQTRGSGSIHLVPDSAYARAEVAPPAGSERVGRSMKPTSGSVGGLLVSLLVQPTQTECDQRLYWQQQDLGTGQRRGRIATLEPMGKPWAGSND